MQFRNERTGETVNVNLTCKEIAASFAETAKDDNWLWFWLAKHVERNQPAPAETVDMVAFLADSFLFAIGMGLKKPMIRLIHGERRYVIYLSQKGTLCFKSGAIDGEKNPVGDAEYIGCIYSGKMIPARDRSLLATEQDMFNRLSADASGFLALASKDMNRCCYCNKPLDDAKSKEAGYGKVCAEKWGLPYGKAYDEKVPSFAQLWSRSNGIERQNVRGMCLAIRENITDPLLWAILGDALQEAGYVGKLPVAPLTHCNLPS